MRQKSDRVKRDARSGHACVCVDSALSAVNVKFVLQRGDNSDAYCAVLEEHLPHFCGEPFVGITWHVGRHNGVIDESREVCAHSGQVTAVCQPWFTTQLIN